MKRIIITLLTICLALPVTAQENWFMAQTDSASVQSVNATSELVEAQFEGKYLYPPINILDGDFSTTWCEAQENGPGIGESITIELSQAVSFDEIQIVNGFATKDYYKKNNRVKTILLTQVADKHYQQKEYTLQDNKADWQSIKFSLPQTAQTITIKITSVYKGSKYDDTCISDFRLLYKGKVIPFKNVSKIKAVQEENSKYLLTSSAKTFEQDFMALFDKYGKKDNYNRLYFYLAAEDGSFFEVKKLSQDEITLKTYRKRCLITNPKNYDAVLSEVKKAMPDLAESLSNRATHYSLNKDSATHVMFGTGGYTPEYGAVEYYLENCRIIKKEWIDYVETTTIQIIKLDGKNMYINGVKYEIVNPDEVYELIK